MKLKDKLKNKLTQRKTKTITLFDEDVNVALVSVNVMSKYDEGLLNLIQLSKKGESVDADGYMVSFLCDKFTDPEDGSFVFSKEVLINDITNVDLQIIMDAFMDNNNAKKDVKALEKN